MPPNLRSDYVLGSSGTEHLRLVRQAKLLEPITERLFREAGIGYGMRVLDVGCGMGDVSMLAARLVGPSGRVVGVDFDSQVLAKAAERAKAAGFQNISFIQSDVGTLPAGDLFDAAVGRFILQFVPDPVAVLKELIVRVRPGGVIAFQEPSYANMLAQTAHLPLRFAALSLVKSTVERSGARTENELHLYRDFRSAGLPSPTLRNELLLGSDAEMRSYLFDLLNTIWPKAIEYGLDRDKLGDIDTLADRLNAELDVHNSFATCLGVVSAFSRRP